MTTTEHIIFEQPINEHIRVCLRLEHLFDQMFHWLHGTSSWDSRAALAALLEILNVLDRPDLKAKLVKELTRYSSLLSRFNETPHIDRTKLAAVLEDIEQTIHHLHNMQGRIAQHLRDNDFLISVRQHLLNPGGGCSFDVPIYHFWLQQPPSERIGQLTHWLGSLKIIHTAVSLALRLIRQSSAPQLHVAHAGFYQSALDSAASIQLIRVIVPYGAGVYPEISVGRHGVSIRFYRLDLSERATQTTEDIRFHLTVCVF